MMKRIFLFAALAFVSAARIFAQADDYRAIHNNALVVDTHNDVVQRILAGEDISVLTKHGHSDLPRFRQGGLDVQMFSIWAPPERVTTSYYAQANEQIDSIMSFVRRNPAQVAFATNSAEVERFVREGKFVAMLGMEGGHHIENDLKKLELLYKRGVRYMTLTWNNSTSWATSALDETRKDTTLKHRGLTAFGRKIVRKMNDLGMMVDVSHVGEQTFWDVMKTTRKPVIASHSSAWTICPHKRNLKDEQLRAVAKNGGVVFINFNPGFIDSTFYRKEAEMRKEHAQTIDSLERSTKATGFVRDQYVAEGLLPLYEPIRPTLDQLIGHFVYVARLIGIDHVGIGSDFDGIEVTPRGMDDVTFLPNITRELLKRGYSPDDVRKVLGGNFLRVLKAVEKK